jgi:hypothetical protein
MPRYLLLLISILLFESHASAALCSFPKEFDLKDLSYRVERIDASLEIKLLFPQLSTVACVEQKVSFGTLWTFDLPVTTPIVVRSVGLNGVTVQEFSIYGEVNLKVTPNWASLHLFNATNSKSLSDYRMVSVELWNSGTLFPTPALSLYDGEQSRRVSVKMQLY